MMHVCLKEFNKSFWFESVMGETLMVPTCKGTVKGERGRAVLEWFSLERLASVFSHGLCVVRFTEDEGRFESLLSINVISYSLYFPPDPYVLLHFITACHSFPHQQCVVYSSVGIVTN